MSPEEEHRPSVSFKPHWTEILKPSCLLPIACAGIIAVFFFMRGKTGMTQMLILASVSAIALMTVLFAEKKRRYTSVEITGGLLKIKLPSGEKTLRLEMAERVEIRNTPVFPLLGSVRLKVYSDASRKAWLSVRIDKRQAGAIVDAVAGLGAETGRILPGRHSGAVYAITSERTTWLLIATAFFTLFLGKYVGKNVGLHLLAALPLALAAADMICSAAYCQRLSLTRHACGIQVTAGFLGGRRIFRPDGSMVGVAATCSPAGLLCGRGSLRLITSGGARLLCACSVRNDELTGTALRLIKANKSHGSSFSDGDALRRKYTFQMIASLFAAFLAALLALRTENPNVCVFACAAGTIMTAAAIRSLAGMRCAGSFGLKISPSAVCAGGTAGCSAAYCCYKRDCIAGVRISSAIFRRMNDLCSAAPFPKGGRAGVKCTCVYYGAVNGLASRFCG